MIPLEQARDRAAIAIARDRVRARYAPSPTGPLHLGNVRTALLAWLQARLAGGVFVMRIEDLDEGRAVPGCADALLDDLRWLGLDWDEGPDVGGPLGSYTQSERKDLYEQVLADLEARDLTYPCYCSRKDIREAASAPHGGYVVYPGTCAGEEGRARAKAKGLAPAYRFRVGVGEVCVEDEVVAARLCQDMALEVGDMVIKRRDGLFAYQLAVVVDDALMGVTDVLRGEDLWDSGPRQAKLYEAMGWPRPRFWHVPLMRGASGEKLSKRDGAESLQELREAGASAPEVVGRLAASCGLVEAGEVLTCEALLRGLTMERFQAALVEASRA